MNDINISALLGDLGKKDYIFVNERDLPHIARWGIEDMVAPPLPPRPESIYGLKVFCDDSLVDRVQVRFPKSKKRRIRRKWAKNPKYWVTRPKPDYYIVGDMLFGHPEVIRKLMVEIGGELQGREDGFVRASKISDPAPWSIWAQIDRMRDQWVKKLDEEMWSKITEATFGGVSPQWDGGYTTGGITKESILDSSRRVILNSTF